MQRQAITIGLFILNAIWFGIVVMASAFRVDRITEDIAALATLLTFFIAVGHLLYPYRGIPLVVLNWWSKKLTQSHRPKSIEKFHKRA